MKINFLFFAFLLVFQGLHHGNGADSSLSRKPDKPQRIYISKIVLTPDPLSEKTEKFQIKTTFLPKVPGIRPSELRIQIFVYNKLHGEITRAKVEARFENRNPRFDSTEKGETLLVDYDKAWGEGDYYGYLCRLIYEGNVEDEAASSSDLLVKIPYVNLKK